MSLPKDIANIGSIANAVYNSITANTTAITSISAAVMDINTGTAIASAATINLNTATGNRVHITGTTTITAVTLTRGPRTVIFDGILTLTHHATTNNLPGAANITTAAGDRAIYEGDGTTVYCVNYIKASGAAVVAASSGFTLGTPVATTSGTAVTFTGIPAGTKIIVISLANVSTNFSSNLRIQLGDAGGIETLDYFCRCTSIELGPVVTVGNPTSGFDEAVGHASSRRRGTMTFVLHDESTNTWVADGHWESEQNISSHVGGYKSLSAVLTQVRITSLNPDTFDSGSVNIAYK